MQYRIPRPEYQRPQFRRMDWTNLNGALAFAFDNSDVGFASGWQNTDATTLSSGGPPFDKEIVVPFCYQSKRSGIGETAFHDVVWYARTFSMRPSATSVCCSTSAPRTTWRRSG